MNNELYLNGTTLDMHAIIKEMQSAENLCAKKIALISFKKGIIRTISDFLSKFKLETLLVCFSTICLDDALAIADFISGSKLLTLELLHSTFKSDALLTIINATKVCRLQKIILVGCTIRMDEAKAIADTIIASRMIKLSFSHCSFQTETLPLILCAVKESTLQTLVLKNIIFNDEDIAAITDCITNANDTLIKLSLAHSTTISDKKTAITEAICNSSLKIVDIQQTPFCSNIGDILKVIEHSRVEKFEFDQSNFTIEEMKLIMDAIKRNPSFKHISLAGVTMSDHVLTLLCDLLENSSLTSLYGCDLSTAQLHELVASIKNSSITALGLRSINTSADWNWDMPDVHALLKCHNLVKLNLCFAEMTNKIIRAMLPSIKDSSLIKFNSNFWHMEPDTKAELKQMLSENQQRLDRFCYTKSAMSRAQVANNY